MKTRLATKADKKEIEEIFNLYWRDSFRENLSEKLNFYFDNPDNSQNLTFIVAEEEGRVLGVAAFRDCPEHMMEFTESTKPAEFYMSAVIKKGKGVGTVLRDERLRMLREQGYTEVVFFGGGSHKDSWGFHDNSDFGRTAEMTAPNGERGYVWRCVIQ